LHHTVDQILVYVGKAQRGHAGGDAFLGVPAPLGSQPLPAGRQLHLGPRQRRPHLPVAHPEFGGDLGMLWPVSQRACR